MCGIIGILNSEHALDDLYQGLVALQHRGQDAFGVQLESENKLIIQKHIGLVRRLENHAGLLAQSFNSCIGHVRYPTAGDKGEDEAQPFYVNSPVGVAIAHNGNLVNVPELKRQLATMSSRDLRTTSDSEVMLNLFAEQLHPELLRSDPAAAIEGSCRSLIEQCQGAYSVLFHIRGMGLVALRDPYGIRPMVWGSKQQENGVAYMIASESCALQACGFQFQDDVRPGTAMFFARGHEPQCIELDRGKPLLPCLFEYLYFARPDSTLNGINVQLGRESIGRALGQRIRELGLESQIDVVIPVPDSANEIALSVADTIGKPMNFGFIKNRYVGRTFIMPDQASREATLRSKLLCNVPTFEKKRVLIVDDSIVRGTTSRYIVKQAREAGASQVMFASGAPRIEHPNFYGISLSSREELVAAGKTDEELAEFLGVDFVVFPVLFDVAGYLGLLNPDVDGFEDSVFSGRYVAGEPSADYQQELDRYSGN
jgi:amidophosphoribosyltransferase